MDKAKDGLYVDSVGDIALARDGWYIWARLGGMYLEAPPVKGKLDYEADFNYIRPISKDLIAW